MARSFLITIIVSVFLLFVTAQSSYAAIKILNGQSGQDQTFSNDTNIGISSTNDIHFLQWFGVLPIIRGGTGASSFTDGSIPFISNGVFSESPNFTWISEPNLNHGISLYFKNENPPNNQGIEFFNHMGGDLFEILYSPADPDALLIINDSFNNGFAVDRTSTKLMAGEAGRLWPPESTLSVVEGFKSTIYIGSSDAIADGQHTGCLVMGDSDGVGVTYVIANDGVLTASTTKPSICQ